MIFYYLKESDILRLSTPKKNEACSKVLLQNQLSKVIGDLIESPDFNLLFAL